MYVSISGLFCFFLLGVAIKPSLSRVVVKTLPPTDIITFGEWGSDEYCEDGQYAVGYEMKIEPPQGNGDDTALNAIRIYCQNLNGQFGDPITSEQSQWGDWGGIATCPQNTYLVAFSLQVEAYIGPNERDDTAANYIKFKCRSFDGSSDKTELAKAPGYGLWGTFSSWSVECPSNSAICGMRTLVEGNQFGGDDTALNDVMFYCCSTRRQIHG